MSNLCTHASCGPRQNLVSITMTLHSLFPFPFGWSWILLIVHHPSGTSLSSALILTVQPILWNNDIIWNYKVILPERAGLKEVKEVEGVSEEWRSERQTICCTAVKQRTVSWLICWDYFLMRILIADHVTIFLILDSIFGLLIIEWLIITYIMLWFRYLGFLRTGFLKIKWISNEPTCIFFWFYKNLIFFF